MIGNQDSWQKASPCYFINQTMIYFSFGGLSYVSTFGRMYADTKIIYCCLFCPGMCQRWPRQRACLRWSSTTPRCRPRCPPSRSPRQTQATPSPCPPPQPPTTEMTTSRCYDAQMCVEKCRTCVHDCHVTDVFCLFFLFNKRKDQKQH